MTRWLVIGTLDGIEHMRLAFTNEDDAKDGMKNAHFITLGGLPLELRDPEGKVIASYTPDHIKQ